MTWRKYRRLLAVLAIPLLGLGAFFFTFVVKPPSYATIICGPGLTGREYCRRTDGLGEEWDQQLRSEHEAWFDVNTIPYEENSYPYSMVSGSQRFVTGAQVLSVSPYAGTTDEPGSFVDQLRSLPRNEIDLILGIGSEQYRPLNPLRCNELSFQEDAGNYVAGLCGVPNGVVSVRFSLAGQEGEKLETLRASVDAQRSEARSDFVMHYLVGVPLFLVLFLLISAIVWAIRRAARYVAAG